MPIQIIPAPRRREEYREQIAANLGNAIGNIASGYQKRQKEKQLGEALKSVESIYGDPNLTQEQKFVKAFSTLREFPEAAKQFSTGLAQFTESPLQRAQRQKLEQELAEGKNEESYLNRLMGGNQPSQEQAIPSADEVEQKPKFDFQDPSNWTNKQLDQFRTLEGKSAKARSLAKRAQNEFERRQETKKTIKKYEEAVAPLESALETLDRMENLGSGGNLGIGLSARKFLSKNARRESSEYAQLGKSLIQLSTNIPIRNRQEFETLAHDLYDPSLSDDSRAGIIEAMRRIIQNSIRAHVRPENENTQQSRTSQNERPPLDIFLK